MKRLIRTAIFLSLLFIGLIAPALLFAEVEAIPWDGITNWYHYEEAMRRFEKKDYHNALNEVNYYFNGKKFSGEELHLGPAFFCRALIYQETGNIDQAIADYKSAIRYDNFPERSVKLSAYMNIGTIYLKKKSYREAIIAYSNAIDIDKKSGLAHYFLGMAYLRSGDIENATKESVEAKKYGVTYTALEGALSDSKNNLTVVDSSKIEVNKSEPKKKKNKKLNK